MNAARFFAFAGPLSLAVFVACGGDDATESPADPDPTNTTGAGASTSSGGSSGASSSGSTSSGGSSSGDPDGGTPGTGCGGTAADPASAVIVESYIDKLPFDKPTGTGRAEVVDAILRACEVFSPSNAAWQKKHCWAHLVSAILKESSYNAQLVENDSYGQRAIGNQKANDPIVGLLQIRFSATVHDYALLGDVDKMACVGCPIPQELVTKSTISNDSPFWAVSGPTQYMSLMQKRACNIGFGAWYYYQAATSNGNASKTTYPENYCAGTATAGNLVTGLRSHFKGPEVGRGVIGSMTGVNALQSSDNDSYVYITEIKKYFDSMNGAVNGTHPFFVLLQPEKARYCR